MTGDPLTFGPDDDAYDVVDAMRLRVARRDALVRATREHREEWDLERAASVLGPGIAQALGIPVLRSSVVPWRTLYAMRDAGASVSLILGDGARFERDLGTYGRPAGGTLDVAERVRREVLLEVRELVHAGLAHLDPKARERRRADELTRELFG